MLALYSRDRTGRGQQVDVGMLDGVVSLLTYHASMHLTAATTSQRVGNRHATIAPYDTFSAADGELGVGPADTWDSEQRCYVCVVRHGDRYHCWFTGNGFGRTGIGHATADAG